MSFSTYLNEKRQDCRELVEALGKHFQYVSILGTDVSATVILRAENAQRALFY